MDEVQSVGSIFAIARDITVTGVLLAALYAFFTDRIMTPKQHERVVAEIRLLVAQEKARADAESERANRWEEVSWKAIQVGQTLTQNNREAIIELTRRR